MEITFLGTGSMVPTKERNHIAHLFRYDTENILIDCGEATQRQLRMIGFAAPKITRILITHWHGDHVIGLPGLICTLGSNEYKKTLHIYGPKGSKKFFTNMMKGYSNQVKVKVQIHEIGEKLIFENQNFKIESKIMKHSTPCIAYSITEKDKININLKYVQKFGLKQHPILKELHKGKDIEWKGKKITFNKATKTTKGKKITFIMDTGYTEKAIELAKDSDLLIIESTYGKDREENAKKYKHLTSTMAAEIAKKAKVKKLILTHFSQRYKTVIPLIKEAKKVFKNTKAAEDFLVLNL